jgi:hypothetical protein
MTRSRPASIGRHGVAAALCAAAGLVGAASPAAGRYEGELCVTIGAQARSCGAVDVQVLSAQKLTVRVADIAYRLALHSSQLDVVTMHGAMQIDGFVAPYAWQGDTLQFEDLPKNTRYELRVAERKRPPA